MHLGSLLACTSLLALLPGTACAADKVLTGAVPEWVEEADLASLDVKKAPAELVADWQHRIEGGTVYSYNDRVIRIDNPQALVAENLLSLGWMPDKGDLTVHRLEILRDGQVIDLLAENPAWDVIRREQGLEMRLLDGELSATLALPGLRVGDVLRVSHTVSVDDQALGEETQVLQFLGSDPWRVGQARTIVSWPDGEDVIWAAEKRVALPAPELRDGYRFLTVDLPLAEAPDMPADAPSRFHRPAILRVGSFADWAELSRVMAPHFSSAAEIDPAGDIAAEAASIMRQTADPLERAAKAVQFVQDEVSYLLDGLEGGNYLPQRAEDTWKLRYGDCKAKTVLLLAMLQSMGIEAEPVLVVSRGGDALPELLPLPGNFDHVIVRARIADTDYWLDGTSTATRLANIADVPPFHYALPLRPGGSDLVPMLQRVKQSPDIVVDMTIDYSAGVDLPYLIEAKIKMFGPQGAGARAIADANDPQLLRRAATAFGRSSGMNGARLTSVDISYDKEEAVGILTMAGVAMSDFEWDEGRLVLAAEGMLDSVEFNPDRARREWRDIPVVTQGPIYSRALSRIVLPDGAKGFSLTGATVMDGGFGNFHVKANQALAGGALTSEADVRQSLGEIAASDVAAAKLAARRLTGDPVKLIAPTDIKWRWDHDPAALGKRVAPALKAYDGAIGFAEEDDFGPLTDKARLLTYVYDYRAALADYDLLVEKSPSPRILFERAEVLESLGRRADAIADLERAYEIDPDNSTAFYLARLLGYEGRAQNGIELLDSLPVTEDEEINYIDAWATVSGLGGDTSVGLELLNDEVAAKPQNSSVLNASCWFRGLFNVALEDALTQCTRAVERADDPVAALDSRAMVNFRKGDHDAALADLDSVLAMAPHVAASRYLRGVVRLAKGDAAGRQDVETALRMSPQLADIYGRHGVVPKS